MQPSITKKVAAWDQKRQYVWGPVHFLRVVSEHSTPIKNVTSVVDL